MVRGIGQRRAHVVARFRGHHVGAGAEHVVAEVREHPDHVVLLDGVRGQGQYPHHRLSLADFPNMRP